MQTVLAWLLTEVHLHDISQWIAVAVGMITLISLVAAVAVRAVKNETIKALTENNDALKERAAELGTEKDTLQQTVAKLRAENHELERRPSYDDVVRLHTEGMEHLDREAAKRQQEFVQTVLGRFDEHNALVASHYEQVAELNRRQEKSREAMDQRMLETMQRIASTIQKERP